MSFQDMAWAVEQECDSPGQKLVLLMLANHCNGHTRRCDPSHKLLAKECSMGVSTLKRNILSLVDAGLLEIIHRAVEGVSLPNQYRLIIKVEGVGPNRTEGRPESDGGVGPNRATNQEFKPGIEPIKNNKQKSSVLPEGFAPNETGIRLASESGLNISMELAAFEDHHRANGSTFIDWQAAFRTWLRNASKFGRRAAPVRRPTPVAQAETFRERDLRLQREEWERSTGRKWPEQDLPASARPSTPAPYTFEAETRRIA